jgi:hypothetical protein
VKWYNSSYLNEVKGHDRHRGQGSQRVDFVRRFMFQSGAKGWSWQRHNFLGSRNTRFSVCSSTASVVNCLPSLWRAAIAGREHATIRPFGGDQEAESEDKTAARRWAIQPALPKNRRSGTLGHQI